MASSSSSSSSSSTSSSSSLSFDFTVSSTATSTSDSMTLVLGTRLEVLATPTAPSSLVGAVNDAFDPIAFSESSSSSAIASSTVSALAKMGSSSSIIFDSMCGFRAGSLVVPSPSIDVYFSVCPTRNVKCLSMAILRRASRRDLCL